MADVCSVTSRVQQIEISNSEGSKTAIRCDVLCVSIAGDGIVVEHPADVCRLHKRFGIQDCQI